MIQLREANIGDVEILKHWDEQPHVIAAAPNDAWDWEQELLRKHTWRELLIAEVDGRPIGFIQIIDPAEEETHYWGEIAPGYRAIDIWIGELSDTRKGYGQAMMTEALNICFRVRDVHSVLIDPLSSNTDAIRFYERIGFKFVENRQFDDDECKVYLITRQDWLRNPASRESSR
jgi:aminoglycoside 6'-N-acetyltransferase